MKRLFLILCLISIVAIGMAQTRVGNSVKDVAGTAADTLTASATKSYVIDFAPFQGKDSGANIELFTDYTSGTATFGYKYWWSNDASNFPATAADSVAAAKSHGSDYVTMIGLTTLSGRYLKVSVIATSATQKSTIHLKAVGYLK